MTRDRQPRRPFLGLSLLKDWRRRLWRLVHGEPSQETRMRIAVAFAGR